MASTHAGLLASYAAEGGDEEITTYHLATTSSNSTSDATQAMAESLKFATSKSIRTSTIILASFNSLAALATAFGIIYGSYTYRKRARRRSSNPSVMGYETKPLCKPTPERPSGLFFIHTVEVFPLVLSLGIAIQSITFAAAQSIGLQALLSRGCTVAGIFMLPALFIAPYTQLVFGVETAVRGIRSRFFARKEWTVAICLGIVGVLLLLTLLVAIANKAPDYCFASLFWFLEYYATGCFVLLLGILVILILAIGTIFVKLCTSHMIEPVERLAASRMTYYLALGLVSNAFIVPYFFSLTFLDQNKFIYETLNLSMIASVVSNVNGLMVAGLHLFLRSQNNPVIGRNFDECERNTSRRDSGGSKDEQRGSTHTMQPLTNTNDDNVARPWSATTLQRAGDAEEGQIDDMPTSPSPLVPALRPLTMPQTPTFPEPAQPPPVTSPSHLQRRSYSLFPNESPAPATTLPATTYSSAAAKPVRDSFRPPPIVKPWLGMGHRRASSIESSATVQIGIRLSNMDDFQPSKVSLETVRPGIAARPSPLARFAGRPSSEYVAPLRPSKAAAERLSTLDARMKNLPPVPNTREGDAGTEAADAGGDDGDMGNAETSEPIQPITLGPSVYEPPEDSRLERSASNRSINRNAMMPNLGGLRFSSLVNENNGGRRSTLQAPPRPTHSVSSSVASPAKGEWI